MHSVGGSQEKAVQLVSSFASSPHNMEGPHQVAGPLWRKKLMERNPRQVSTKQMSSLTILFNPESPNLLTHRTIVTKGPIQGTVLL